MPELPDILLYIEALQARLRGDRLLAIETKSPFLVRTYDPPIEVVRERCVQGFRRLGKRIVIELEAGIPESSPLFVVIHLMIAGRLQWHPGPVASRQRTVQATLRFATGCLLLTEAGSKKRASIHLVQGESALAGLDPGGLEPLTVDLPSFRQQVRAGNHTLKRILTDPRRFSGIGNAYSDEILHRARLSPVQLSRNLTDAEVERLFLAVRITLSRWIERLRDETGDAFPAKVTAFRPEMAVHGRFRKPCPDCGAPVQRIVYRDHETNYCAPCQTGGKLLADRALSRLLGSDWPKTLEGWE
ncbi:MAG: DNA-formamidopyrimidine glycosylase family protein [Planctomycetota bacterium]